jgi:cytochrome c-type biogenesis protein CcmH
MRSGAAVAFLVAVVCALAIGAPVAAKEAAPEAADPALEARMVRITSELRCLVCQNQTIADSSADLAVDLRGQIRERLAKGASEREVLDFMVQRYGDFVLYKPPFKASTVLLWCGPFLLLALGIVLLARRVGSAKRQAPAPLSAEERLRAAALLEPDKE